MTKQRYDLEERLLEFSVRIIKIVEQLPNTRAGNHVAGQLLRSGTSPYPNHGEAQAAESPKDFIHKLRISLLDVCFFIRCWTFDVRCSTFIFQNNPAWLKYSQKVVDSLRLALMLHCVSLRVTVRLWNMLHYPGGTPR